jgi:diamine N-acetyltransferase
LEDFKLNNIPAFDPTRLHDGMFIIVNQLERIPPHICMIIDNRFYNLNPLISLAGTSYQPYFEWSKTIQKRMIFFEVKHIKADRNRLSELMGQQINEDGVVDGISTTCLTSIARFFTIAFGVDVSNATMVWQFVPLLQQLGLTSCAGQLYSDEPTHQFQPYTMHDIRERVAQFHENYRRMMHGETAYLRALEPSDLEVLYKWENDPETWKISHTLVPFSKHQLKQYVESPQDIFAHQQVRFIICNKEDDRPIGAIDLFDFEVIHQRAGVGILIADSSDRGKGYGREALQLLIGYAFKRLPLEQLYCNILTDNEPSLKLFQNAGFEITGTKKSWVKTAEGFEDEYLLQLMKPVVELN